MTATVFHQLHLPMGGSKTNGFRKTRWILRNHMQGLIRRETIATELREVLRGIPAYRSTLASECDVFLYARSTPSVEIATSDTEMAVVFDPTAPGQFEAVRSVIARWIDARNGMVK